MASNDDNKSDEEESNSEDDCSQALIIDNGSGFIKAGFGGDDTPRVIIPNVIGHSRMGHMIGMSRIDYYVGNEAHAKRGMLRMKRSMDADKITSWDDMEKIWNHTFFKELQSDPKEHDVLLTEPPLNAKQDREMTTQIMFETFEVPSFYLANQASLALYATGRTTGLVLDIGYGITQSVSIYEGYALPHSVRKSEVAGQQITEYLMKLLNKNGNVFTAKAEMDIVNGIKEKWAYIAMDIEEEKNKGKENEKEYELPDGTTITVGNERFECAELLFGPQEKGIGIHQLMYESIQKCDANVRKNMFGNIVLSGGSTMLPGIEKRLSFEMSKFAPDNVDCKSIATPERKYAAWIGASIFGSLRTFGDMWISKEMYDESGPGIVHRRCM